MVKIEKKILVKSNVFYKDVDLTSKQLFSMGLNIKWIDALTTSNHLTRVLKLGFFL